MYLVNVMWVHQNADALFADIIIYIVHFDQLYSIYKNIYKTYLE